MLAPVGLALALGDQVVQAAVDVGAPGVRADAVAFVCGDEAYVREANFCFVAFLGNFKDNVGVLPFALVFDEVEVVVYNVPHNLLAWNKLGDPDGAAVNVLVAVLEFTELIGPAVDLFRPPSTNVIDCGESCFRGLVHQKDSGVVLIAHLPLQFCG